MRRLTLFLLVSCGAALAHADGGHLQMRQIAGPFVVSLFTTPETLAVGPADVSVLIEEQSSGPVLLDADTTVVLTREGDGSSAITAHLSHGAATNRLLQAAQVTLPSAGRWHAEVQVREGNRNAVAATDLLVADQSARRGTVWFFALLPACMVALFVWGQTAKRRSRRRHTAVA